MKRLSLSACLFLAATAVQAQQPSSKIQPTRVDGPLAAVDASKPGSAPGGGSSAGGLAPTWDTHELT